MLTVQERTIMMQTYNVHRRTMIGGTLREQKDKPMMLNAAQVAERLNMSKGYAYKVIREMNDEQEALGRPVVKGRVRSDHFERRYFAGDEDVRI